MNRFLCFLGVLGLLAGASFVLPDATSAAACGGPFTNNTFVIAELPVFQLGPETYQCTLPSAPTSVVNFDMLQGGVVSDHVGVVVGSTPVLVTLVSDGETGLSPTAGATQVTESTVACPTGFGPENEPGGERSCDGSNIPLTFGNTPGNLFVFSDIGTVPEPSTALLLGAALPALFGLRRRSMGVSA